ncbi:hypothetical protein JMJ77_0005025 [Colletotrichum scovillei]|uniref:Uncharacterized protein n=1 Tax=Colletotrichum scovillei TaxID=1209932 RepID=A0A9P7UID2_9PEZI|nr:hypothetical protein JMJ77_0005025 [Colletotrichum scovillei]KAG7076238.1 hypothetical protein JMJ76_0013504 [Colletotrichum scovillei]KAG7083350.1 hypothetical protein JMJ78_0008796 [Colletotrichum scovillei]
MNGQERGNPVESQRRDEPRALDSSSGREPRPGGEKFWSEAWHSVPVGLPSACGVGSPCCGLPLSGTPVEGSGKVGRSSCLRLVGTQGESCSLEIWGLRSTSLTGWWEDDGQQTAPYRALNTSSDRGISQYVPREA